MKKETDDSGIMEPTPFKREGQPSELIPCYTEDRQLPFLKRNLSYIRRAMVQQQQVYDGDYYRFPRMGKKEGKPCVYQFHTLRVGHDTSKVVTLYRNDASCPLCGFVAYGLEGLWMHMVTSNRRYKFSALKDKDGTYHIAADPNITMTPRKRRVESTKKHAFENQLIYERKRNIFCQKISSKGAGYRPYEPEPEFHRKLAREQPIRDYYQPLCFNRITVGEWMLLDKVIQKGDETWKLRIANSMLEDFNDVADKEKAFIKLWNAFVRDIIHVPERKLKQYCMKFIGMHANVIQGYEENLISHLINLWEEHQLFRDDLVEIMEHFSEIICAKMNEEKEGEARIDNKPPLSHVIMTPQPAAGNQGEDSDLIDGAFPES